MNNQDKFLKSQKVLRLATIGRNKTPHIVPVWYLYNLKKIYIGTNTRTQKVKNVKKNRRVSFCVDVGIKSPDIQGMMGQGNANLILEKSKVKQIAKKILLKYFNTMKNISAKELLNDTDCIIEIIPEKWSRWLY
ncbi:MAG: pyridoxamine 5'-phosphate oxidase family protein [Nitrosopumilus sp.]|jgi:nitroimidazol reductase NimA-like FMN-containing flavoprotein (pyridoxamine 5'-phosphate oxidase superfamily)|nr:pyridoxamine 5'-phosphate oxidase family protein [Nitrosopumilus sp.]